MLSRRDFATGLAAASLISRPISAIAPSPRLTVWIIVEQLRPDHLEAVGDRFVAGGLKRMMDDGSYFHDCRHTASTFTATSLTTLATGTWPSVHGIVADNWYDRAARRPVAASDEALLATTLVAQVAADPRRRAYVLGPDAATTRLFAGTPAASLFWMDEGGQFVTPGQMPDWLIAYNRQKPIENSHDAKWLAMGAKPDAPPLRVLTYNSFRPDDFFALYRSSWICQEAPFELLKELIARERLGQGPTSDLVCLVLGPSARLGYETGADSPLMQQLILHLDRNVEFLLNELTRTPGDSAFNLILSAGHGVPPEPSAAVRARMAVQGEAVAQTIQKVIAPGIRVEKYVYPFLYLEGAARENEASRLAAARAAMSVPAVAGYLTAGGACSAQGDWANRFRNSFHPARSGEVMLSYRPEYVEEFGATRGISYGSLYNYDVRVPLCFYGPQFRMRTFEDAVQSVDVAPTLARALGVAQPSSSSGRVLGEALARNLK